MVGDSRQFEVTIRPILKGGYAPLSAWVLKGKVKRLLGPDEAFLDLGKHSDVAPQPSARRIMLEAAVPCQVAIDGKPDWLETEVVARDGKSSAIEARARAGLAAGVYIGPVQLAAHLPDGETVKAAAIPARIEILPDLQAAPQRVAFGLRRQGERCTEAVAIRSLTGRPFKAVRYRVEGPDAAIVPDQSRPFTFAISVEVTGRGRRDGAAVFTVELQDGKTSEIRVPIGYHGAKPE